MSARNKIRSRRGASITFALLLFLVCAVVSSVIIVTGTAAGGRLAEIAEIDQRYYAVTSAAELLRDALDGQTMKVEMVKTSTRILDQDGGELVASQTKADHQTNPYDISIYVPAGAETPFYYREGDMEYRYSDNLSIFAKLACDVAHATEYVTGSTADWMPRKLDLTLDGLAGTEGAAEAAAVTIYERPMPNGDVTFYIEKKDARKASEEEGKNPAYILKLDFRADVKQNVNNSVVTGTPTNVVMVAEGGGFKATYRVEETTTEITDVELTWSLANMKKCNASELPEIAEGEGA